MTSRTPAPIWRTHRLAILALTVLLGCAAGAPRASSSRRETVDTLPDGSKMICRMELPTGSHIAEQVCRKVVPKHLDTTETRTQTQLAAPKSADPMKGTN